jgi:hypothetical protein
MRTTKAVLIAIIATLVTSPSFAQNSGTNDENATLVARLSYNSTWFVSADQKTSPRICFAVFKDGHYRMLRRTADGKSRRLQGTIVPEELRQIEVMLDAPGFRALAGQRGGGLVRSGSERFVAEVPRKGGVQRLLWINPDREEQFPDAAAEVIDWLQHFEPRHAESLVDTEFPDVCPQLGPGVRPIFAANLKPASPLPSCSRDASGMSSSELR